MSASLKSNSNDMEHKMENQTSIKTITKNTSPQKIVETIFAQKEKNTTNSIHHLPSNYPTLPTAWHMMAVVHTAEVKPNGKAKAPSNKRATKTINDTSEAVEITRPRPSNSGMRNRTPNKNTCFFVLFSHCFWVNHQIFRPQKHPKITQQPPFWKVHPGNQQSPPPCGAPDVNPMIKWVKAARAKGI